MIKIQIKPISVNEAYRGRRYKTTDYKAYERELAVLLPSVDVPEGKLEVYYRFGLSSKGSDYDNQIKAFQDIISKKYGFNDNRIYRALIEKVDTKKGEEFIEFEVSEYFDRGLVFTELTRVK